VDDNATNRRILEETLKNWGMRPTVVAGARDAMHAMWQAAQEGEPFPLVLLDAHMPDMDGFSLAERMRQQPELAGATVMMLSSGGQSGDVARCRELGVAMYLTKPVKQLDLWRALMAALGKPAGSTAARAAPAARPKAARCLRILLAEDNPFNQKLAVRILENRGHTVVVTANGREALDVLQRQPFDLVLMDVQMPEMDGLEATARIRAREKQSGEHVPIIAMTAYAMKGDRERCLDAGMDGYVSKPVRQKELFEAIEGAVPSAGPDPSPERTPPALAFLDWKEALSHVGGDRQLLRELVDLFLEHCPRWLADVRRAATQGDGPKLKAAAHAIKGSLGSLAAGDAYEAALRLETMGREGKLEDAEEACQALEDEISRIRPALLAFARDTAMT
jgi:CheY-like chemotaxis protein/HPt (histidine-containing phosphotransfer) domain-containing protein